MVAVVLEEVVVEEAVQVAEHDVHHSCGRCYIQGHLYMKLHVANHM